MLADARSIERFSHRMRGQTCRTINRSGHQWLISFSEVELSVETLWRLVDKGQLVVTSEDDGHKFGLPAAIDAAALAGSRLIGQSLSACEVDLVTADLTLTFGNGAELQIVSTSCGYESWQAEYRSGAEEAFLVGSAAQPL